MTSIAWIPLLVDDRRAPTAKDDRPGCGCLLVHRGERRLSLPLRSVAFAATVVERIAEVTVEQVFENSYDELLEAVYIFPLPGGAAVSRFELHVGDKQLLGIVEERGEARRQYQAAIAEGRKAALLEQERDDVFTVKVGNLPPRSRAKIKMVYSERLPAFDDGETELRIPLVVAPRYIPGNPLERASTGDGVESDTTRVPDASRISPPRLAPGMGSDVALSIDVSLLGESEIQDLGCTQHATKLGAGSGRLTVKLAKKDELLDRDFVLRWKCAGATEKPLLFVTRKGDQVYGCLSVVPPREVRVGAGARDVLFLLDRSGSMKGDKLDSAKRAIAGLLNTLATQDRFAICAFDDGSKWFKTVKSEKRGETFFPVSASSFDLAGRWLDSVSSGGGTELLPALGESLEAFAAIARGGDTGGRLQVVVLVTDGQVGNEGEVLRRIETRAAGLRIFTLGIDTAVNAAFLRRLAQIGRGTATLCEPGPALEGALERIGREIGTPVLVDLEVEDQGLGIDRTTLTPARLPDVFAGRTASVFFRCKSASGSVRIRARRASGGAFDQVVAAETLELASIPQLWGKSRVADLEDEYRVAYGGSSDGLERARGQILEFALEHQLLTRFTSFLVIDRDEAERRMALPKRTIVQAVEQPKGWDKAQDARLGRAKKGGGMWPSAAAPAAFQPLDMSADPFERASQAPGLDAFAAPDLFASDPFAAPPSGSLHRSAPSDPFGAPPPAGGFARGGPSPLGGGGSSRGGGAAFDDALDGMDPGEAFSTLDLPMGGTPGGSAGRAMPASPADSGSRPPASRAPRQELGSAGPVPGSPARLGRGGASPPSASLEQLVESLGKELARVLLELEQGRWIVDDGVELQRLALETLQSLGSGGFAARAPRTIALLSAQVFALVQALAARRARPTDLAPQARAASEAFAAQARSELAPLLGKGGTFWEATI